MLGPSLIVGVVHRAALFPGVWRRVALGLVCAALAAAGCARVPIKPDEKNVIKTTLFSTTANGQTSLSWASQTNLVYTVLMSERWNDMRWQPLPACVNQPGTGHVMQYTIEDVPGRKRVYKLLAGPRAKP